MKTLLRLMQRAALTISKAANVFSYLQNAQIQPALTAPSNNIETLCVMFDDNFWGSEFAQNAPGTPLVVPPRPQQDPAVTHWGLRTLWAYFIDNHLDGIDGKVGPWLQTARNEIRNTPMAAIADRYMLAGGLATVDQMHFPRTGLTIPIPGHGSTESSASRYMMWNNGNNYGPLGL